MLKTTIPALLSLSALLFLSGCNGSNATSQEQKHDSSVLTPSTHQAQESEPASILKEKEALHTSSAPQGNIETEEKRATISATVSKERPQEESSHTSSPSSTESSPSETVSSASNGGTTGTSQTTETSTQAPSGDRGECRIYNPITGGCEAY